MPPRIPSKRRKSPPLAHERLRPVPAAAQPGDSTSSLSTVDQRSGRGLNTNSQRNLRLGGITGHSRQAREPSPANSYLDPPATAAAPTPPSAAHDTLDHVHLPPEHEDWGGAFEHRDFGGGLDEATSPLRWHDSPSEEDEDDSASSLGARFLAALQQEPRALIVRLAPSIWILPGWKDGELQLDTSRAVHFRHDVASAFTVCPCLMSTDCAHLSAFEFDAASFLSLQPLHDTVTDIPAVALITIPTLARVKLSFSVAQGAGRHRSGKRCLVSYGLKERWQCSAGGCRATGSDGCEHAKEAQASASEMRLWVPGTAEQGAAELCEAAERGEEAPGLRGISHLPRGPPLWLRLEEEDSESQPTYPSLAPFNTEPSASFRYTLDADSRCKCGLLWSEVQSGAMQGARWDVLIIHTESGAREVEIQTVLCPRCHNGLRRIGPDLLQAGLFNWNNQEGFARELFDGFLANFSSHEQTFGSFLVALGHRYLMYSSMHSPPKYDTFTRAFYAFAKLLQLETPMSCLHCGPRPDVVICDGVSMGFAASKLRGGLRPPTLPSSRSVSKPLVVPTDLSAVSSKVLGLSPAETRDLRKGVRSWGRTSEGCRTTMPAEIHELVEKVEQMVDSLPRSVGGLLKAVDNLVNLPQRNAYLRLLEQVFAPDPIFTLLPIPLLDAVSQLSDLGGIPSLDLCRHIPVLADITAFGPLHPLATEVLVVVYDFACSLASYCWLREPAFFRDTRFYVDELHAHGHSACSSAGFLASAMQTNNNLVEINSSAAEAAHTSIGKNRLTFSYQNEEHGAQMVALTFNMHNRIKRKKMLSGLKKQASSK
ncbi:hypothetical protein Rhopal_000098-T1 [Rhodotorula paludigena]|uniref:HMG domain-containing protein n=1 Tax=Rhodotorula paludigena TaxID=86838 RepID=A0AAV5G9Y1_9BASI|nr:hypothetical protein Rhopal_000098-T1 [Rhodotorula paludigena]